MRENKCQMLLTSRVQKKNEKHIENIPIKRKDKTSVLFAFNNNLI